MFLPDNENQNPAVALLPPLLGLFTGGILTFYSYRFVNLTTPFLVFSITGIFLAVRVPPASRVRTAWVGLLFFFFGLTLAAWRAPDLINIGQLPQKKITLEGIVASVPELRHDRVRFRLKNETYGQVRISTASETEILPGDRVRVSGRLKRIRGFRNPGLPDSAGRLRRQGILYRLWSPEVSRLNRGKTLLGPVFSIRARLARALDRDFGPEKAGFLKAIVLGVSDLPDKTRDAFAGSGTAHLLAVSGTHLSLLMAIVFFCVRALLRQMPPRIYLRLSQRITASQLAFLLSIPVVLGYALLAGARIPAIRALFMMVCFGAALLTNRGRHWPTTLSGAALLILAAEPWALFEISFQLTFAAVAAIGTLALPLARSAGAEAGGADYRRSPLVWLVRQTKTFLVVSIAASVGTAPLVSHYFNQMSTVSPLANLVVTPLTGLLAIPAGLAHGCLLFLFGQSFLGAPLNLLAGAILSTVGFFSDLPFSSFALAGPPLVLLIAFYGALILPRTWRMRVALLCLISLLSVIDFRPPGQAELTMIDVGQGEALFFQMPEGTTMLVDTGGLRYYDIGARVVTPFLLSRGVRSLDRVVLTHAHPDHAGGFASIAEKIPVRELLWNGQAAPLMERLRKALPETEFRVVSAGDRLSGPDYEIEVLHPTGAFTREQTAQARNGRNSQSLVLRIQMKGTIFLLTADIGKRQEAGLALREGSALRADILKVSHHGGKGSSEPGFLATVRPTAALISAGYANRFRHPRAGTLKRLDEAGAIVFRTDQEGAITMRPSGKGDVRVITWQDTRPFPAKNPRDVLENLRRILLNKTTGGRLLDT